MKYTNLNGALTTDPSAFKGYIENYIGITQIPTGLAGPLLIDSSEGLKEVFIPMATTEGGLVISYSRGIKLVSACGGVTSRCIASGVQRAPGFKLENLDNAIQFEKWVKQQQHHFQSLIPEVSTHATLKGIASLINGHLVTIEFNYDTQDAAGQNMSTICTQRICEFIIANSPYRIITWFIESNFSSDKKPSIKSLLTTRGRKVVAEATVTRMELREQMKVTPEQLIEYWNTIIVNTIQIGGIGMGGHFSNGIAAIFLACGQDVACVAEASIGHVFGEIDPEGNLYVSVTLPNLIVGTVGGGTTLPTQRECLELMNCFGDQRATHFSGLCGATLLAGEISIAASIAVGSFARAHALYGRRKKNAYQKDHIPNMLKSK